jgi:hypothetical protein
VLSTIYRSNELKDLQGRLREVHLMITYYKIKTLMKTILTKTGYCLLAVLLLSASRSNNAYATNNSNPGKVITTPVKPLYVSLLYFHAALVDNTTGRIDWATQTEESSDYFIIRKSTNGKTFMTIGEVNSAGNRNEPTAYYFVDNSPVKVTTYYKILEVDKDGKTTDLGTEVVNPKSRR